MNKKVLTLCAGLLLAGSATAWGQVWIDASATDVTSVAASGNYKIAATAVNTTFNAFVQDNSTMTGKAGFPNVSPFAINLDNGAKPIDKLNHVNDDQADTRYFQFVVGGNGENTSGKEVLTMVWVDQKGTVANPSTTAGHYELQVENVTYANFADNPIKLDRTLWKVTAKKDAAGTVLYYELQNKGTDAILQLSQNPITGTNAVTATNADGTFQEVSLNIVAGQTDWRWSDGEEAALKTGISSAKNNSEEPLVLQNTLRAQYSNGTTLHLVKKTETVGGNEKITLAAVIGNSNADPDGAKNSTNTIEYNTLTFEAWEANPIILTAAQLNSELGAELLTADKDNGKMHFTFDPDVQGDTNIMLNYDFKAVDAIADGSTRVPGDAPDGFVRFQNANDDSQYLYVDTAYYDDNVNGRYDLKLNVSAIQYSRYAVAATPGLTVVDGKLVLGGSALSNDDMYDGTTEYPAVQTYVQMKRQSNFRPIFYPATQSLRLQAEMLYKAGKKDLNDGTPWWKQMSDDAVNTSSHMEIASAASDPTIDVVSNPTAARGYYPAYAYNKDNVKEELRIVQYVDDYAEGANGYEKFGDAETSYNATQMGSGAPLWNAVGNLYNGNTTINGQATANNNDVWIIDPAWESQASTVTDAAARVFSPVVGRTAYSNLVRLTSLTPGHVVLTADKHDAVDDTYNGLNTYISLAGLRQNTQMSTAVDIDEAFYYIQNENSATQLADKGDYRYEDLAATNAMFTYWNNMTEAWDRGISCTGSGAIKDYAETTSLGETIKQNTGLNEATHKNDNATKGNLVYSSEKLAIPSAQWYIKGNGDHYVMINRESGRQWNTEYWWATDEPDVFVNQATYKDAAGQTQVYRDTIRITKVPAAELTNKHMGYLFLDNNEAMADTTVFNVGMESLGSVNVSLSVNEAGNLVMTPDSTGAYKLERVLVKDEDPFESNAALKVKPTTELIYGYVPTVGGEIDSSKMLERAKYYIYKDEVNANSGIEPTSVRTRQYVTLNAGKYQIDALKVQFDNDLYTTVVDGTDTRRAFYIKQITPKANQFVLVDPDVVGAVDNNTGKKAYGARVFVNQMTGELQPGSLVSDGYANSYATSIFNIDKISQQNYFDIRREGADLDTVKIFVANNPSYLLGENSNVKGANVGLLELREVSDAINNALFVDTANLSNAACPRFLLGVRDSKKFETSNLDNHNRHLYTKAAYLVNLKDSAATNAAYKYSNAGINAKEYYRLGFIEGTHYYDKNAKASILEMDESGKKFNLTALGATGFDLPVFAFRYVDTDRDNFYIETTYDGNKKGWIEIHNGVAVVTDDIQRAEVFSYEATEETATANETIAAEGAVSVVATDGAVIVKGAEGKDGAVIVKGAEGKNVVIATILGKVVANETINSDNETIAVPAGIAVVSVDGESFKVVVK